jgi:hypothetical protein
MQAGIINKKVYILLTRTNTLISRLIATVTGTRYTHAALSLDYRLTRLYSFGRLYTYYPFIGRFKHEQTSSGVYGRFRRSPCALFELQVSETSYDAICARIAEILRQRDRYKYNIIGLLGNYVGRPIRRKYRYFCSEFVADTLIRGDALRLNRDPALVRPSDFLEMVELKPVFYGTIETLEDFIKRIDDNAEFVGELPEVTTVGECVPVAGDHVTRPPFYIELIYSLLSLMRRA